MNEDKKIELGILAYKGHPKALQLSKEEFIDYAITYYKTSREYLQAGESREWYLTCEKRMLSEYYNDNKNNENPQ